MASGFDILDPSVSKLTKVRYGQKAKNMYNALLPVLGLAKKTYGCVGEKEMRSVPMSLAGGLSFGQPIKANAAKYEKPEFTTKRVYATGEIDGRTIAQFEDNGAFVKAIEETTKKQVEAFNFLMEFNVTGNGDGTVGAISSVAAVSATVYNVVITNATWVAARWQLRQIMNVGTSDDQFEITAVTRSSKTIQLTRIAGTTVPAAADNIYFAGGRLEYVQGLDGITSATTGTLYGVTVADGWQSYQKDAGSSPISPDLLTEAILGVWDQVGINPTHILTPTLQLRKLMSSLEDLKRYDMTNVKLSPRVPVGNLGWKGVNFSGPVGDCPLVASRMIKDSVMLPVNFDELEIAHSKQGWLDMSRGGVIFSRIQGRDAYESLYGGYLEVYAPPTVNGRIHTLSTAV